MMMIISSSMQQGFPGFPAAGFPAAAAALTAQQLRSRSSSRFRAGSPAGIILARRIPPAGYGISAVSILVRVRDSGPFLGFGIIIYLLLIINKLIIVMIEISAHCAHP